MAAPILDVARECVHIRALQYPVGGPTHRLALTLGQMTVSVGDFYDEGTVRIARDSLTRALASVLDAAIAADRADRAPIDGALFVSPIALAEEITTEE